MTRSIEQIAESLEAIPNLDNVRPDRWAATYGVETEQVAELVRAERSRRKVAA